MEALTQTQSIIYFILTGVAIVALTILSPLYGAYSIMIDLGLVAIYGNKFNAFHPIHMTHIISSLV
jgi:hypothetical protein